jgi:hypothetical protein
MVLRDEEEGVVSWKLTFSVADLSVPGSLWLLAPGVVLKNYFCSLEPGLRVGRVDNDFKNANCFFKGVKGGECLEF